MDRRSTERVSVDLECELHSPGTSLHSAARVADLSQDGLRLEVAGATSPGATVVVKLQRPDGAGAMLLEGAVVRHCNSDATEVGCVRK